MDVVKSLQDTKRYFRVIHSSKCKEYVEQICIADSCNCNATRKTSRTDRNSTERLTTTDM